MTWQEKEDKLVLERTFTNFTDAMQFVNAVAKLAEVAQHHPDIHLEGWNRVRLVLYTHSEKRITAKDKTLAEKISDIKEKNL